MDARALPWQETGRTVHVSVGIYAGVNDTVNSLHESFSHYSGCQVPLQLSLHGRDSFQTLLAPPQWLNFETRCNGGGETQARDVANVFSWGKDATCSIADMWSSLKLWMFRKSLQRSKICWNGQDSSERAIADLVWPDDAYLPCDKILKE